MNTEPIASIESIGSVFYAVAAVGSLLMAAWGASKLLRRLLRFEQAYGLAYEIVFLVAGLHLVGFIGVCLGMTGVLGGGKSLILIGLFAAFGIADMLRKRLLANDAIDTHLSRGVKPSWEWLIATPFLLLTLGPALNLPTGWDELVYHSVLPRRWLADGWPAFYVDIPYSGFPSLLEILCWLVAPIESIITSRLLVWVGWLLGLCLAYSMFRRSADRSVAFSIAIALAASPVSLMISANCYVEAIQMVDLLAIVFLLNESFQRENSSRSFGYALLVGILLGGSISIKLTGASMIAAPLISYGMNGFGARRLALPLAKCCIVIVICSSLIAMPFYLRPWMLAANPLYPYFATWFSNDTSLIETSLYHHSIGSDAFGLRGVVAYLATSFLIAWENDLYDGTLGWQWILLMVLAVLGSRNTRSDPRENNQAWLGPAALVLYSFWFFSAQQARFAVPMFATVVLLATNGFQGIAGKAKTWVSVLLVGLTVLSLPWRNTGYYLASWERLLGIWNNTQYVDDSLEVEYIPLVAAIEKLTPSDARLMLVFEHRSLYLPRRCVIGTPFFQAEGFTPPEQFSAPEQVLRCLKDNKISHLVFGTKSLGPDRSGQWWNRGEPLFASIEKGIQLEYLKPLWTTDNYLLLQVVGEVGE